MVLILRRFWFSLWAKKTGEEKGEPWDEYVVQGKANIIPDNQNKLQDAAKLPMEG